MRIIVLLLIVLYLPMCAQVRNLESLSPQKRNVYLVKIAKEVTLNVAKEYYREYKDPLISEIKVLSHEDADNRPEMQKLVGRKYYSVSFQYNKDVELFEMDYASCVCIWADDGRPWCVDFGNGWGYVFTDIPYEQYVKSKKKVKIPYEKIPSDLHKLYLEQKKTLSK